MALLERDSEALLAELPAELDDDAKLQSLHNSIQMDIDGTSQELYPPWDSILGIEMSTVFGYNL